MKRAAIFLAAILGGLRTFAAPPDLTPTTTAVLNPVAEGRQLAERLRSSGPAENSEFHGTLIIRRRGAQTNRVPVHSTITTSTTNWQVTYQTTATTATPVEKLTIIRAPGCANEYWFSRATNPPAALPAGQADAPFAGSDFLLSDLALEFLHWPGQKLIKHEMRRGRSCRVLESVNPNPGTNGYARLLSWIDVETDGILRAEAYDQKTNLVKEFLVGPVKKVNGQWQLQDMKMILPKTRHETELQFDLDRK